MILAFCVPAAQAAPAPNWNEEAPAHSPGPRESAAMAYDAVNQEMVLFGGLTQAGVRLDDTWTWDGSDWTKESPAHSPSPRSSARMAFDPNTEQLILVGGQTGEGIVGETWTWNGGDWTELSPTTPAPAAAVPSMAADPATGNVLLFGGNLDGDVQNWTWSWNGSTWTQLAPQTSPPPRWGASMAYDPTSEKMMLFSGSGESLYNDTWSWNGTTWSREFPADSPMGIGAGSMAFSPAAGTPIQLGGEGGTVGDTWTFGVQTGQEPTATISSPADGQTFEVGEQVPVSFSCSAATDGPPVATCVGSDGSPAPSGQLDTTTIGSHTYTVTATASDGQTGSASITYEVGDPRPPACRPVPGGLTLDTFGLRPPLGDAPPVPGFRVRLAATRRVDARISPRIVYRTRSGRRSFQYRSRTVRIDRVRRLRFELPPRVRRQMFRAHGFVYGNRVTFRLRGQLKARGDRADCFGRAESLAYELPVVAVSSRVALRRR
ncbi:MAG: hypothetical protein J0H98_07960 [Solirubrobacterales bacterium]|nr:hypothetical protein [Solirubrobacterales bacterium]